MKALGSKLVGALVAVGALIGVANAQEVVVYETPVGDSIQGISADFAVNRQLGRAWVDVTVQRVSIGSEPDFPLPIEEHVDGLSYDSARKQVVYRTASGDTVCAEDTGDTLKNTGNCQLISTTEQRKVDDGFDVSQQKVAKVVFDVPATAARQQAEAAR